jgi:hypothetical protein
VNQVVYTPDNDYLGIDSFSYTATDGALTSASATVSLTVFYKHLNTPQQLGETLLGENNSDYFGNAVAMSQDGSIIAVGAKNADINNINDSGELKVYQKTVTASSSVVSWTQLGSSISGPQYSYYGRAVAMSLDGYTLITNNRVYRYSNGDWVQLGSDLSYTPSDYNSLSMNGDGTVVAVATNDYVQSYRFTNGEWIIKGSAIFREASSDYSNAIALSLDGNVLAIGAYGNDGGGSSAGHVRVFGYTLSAGWTQWGDDLDGSSASDEFGSSVALNGNGSILAVGARLDDVDSSDTMEGSVKIYSKTVNASGTISWTQKGSTLFGQQSNDRFGSDVSLDTSGNSLAVGAFYSSQQFSQGGYAAMYQWYESATDWSAISSNIYGQYSSEYFGYGVSLSSDATKLIVGGNYYNS